MKTGLPLSSTDYRAQDTMTSAMGNPSHQETRSWPVGAVVSPGVPRNTSATRKRDGDAWQGGIRGVAETLVERSLRQG